MWASRGDGRPRRHQRLRLHLQLPRQRAISTAGCLISFLTTTELIARNRQGGGGFGWEFGRISDAEPPRTHQRDDVNNTSAGNLLGFCR